MTDNLGRLGEFLRSRREALTPEAVGLASSGRRRRVKGLRRDEVAKRAGISTDYYTRLEQGRVPLPSATVLAGLIEALLLDSEEEDYILDIARERYGRGISPGSEQVPTSILKMIDDLATLPAFVLDPVMHLVAWNQQAADLFIDFGAVPEDQRNFVRLIYLDERVSSRLDGWEEIARSCTAILRAGEARDPGNEELAALLDEIIPNNELFGDAWRSQPVSRRAYRPTIYTHPELGPMTFDWQLLTSIEDPYHTVVVINPDRTPRCTATPIVGQAVKTLRGT